MKVIINADDFGVSERVNNAIIDLFGKRKITSTTLLANGRETYNAVNNANDDLKRCIGIHLNITAAKALTNGRGLAKIIQSDGNFKGLVFLKRLHFTPEMIKGIYSEFCAQVEYVRSLGIRISHVDTHQHVHMIPEVLCVVRAVMRKYNVGKIRISKNIYNAFEKPGPMLSIKKNIYNFIIKRIMMAKTTDGFSDLTSFYQRATKGEIDFDSVELMVHPGMIGKDLEWRILNSFWTNELSMPVELISYNEL